MLDEPTVEGCQAMNGRKTRGQRRFLILSFKLLKFKPYKSLKSRTWEKNPQSTLSSQELTSFL